MCQPYIERHFAMENVLLVAVMEDAILVVVEDVV